jgi:hypothetical protein
MKDVPSLVARFPHPEPGKCVISKVRAKLGLDKTVGCAPSTYLVEEPLSKPDSLWELFITKVTGRTPKTSLY